MSRDINLAMLNKRKREMDHNEMYNVRGGIGGCECHEECGTQPLHHEGFYENNSWADLPVECPCGSVWVVFGLML